VRTTINAAPTTATARADRVLPDFTPLTLVCHSLGLRFGQGRRPLLADLETPRELRRGISARLKTRNDCNCLSVLSVWLWVVSLCTDTLTHGTTGQTNEPMHTTPEERKEQREERRGGQTTRAGSHWSSGCKKSPLARVCLTMHAFVYVCCSIPQPLLPSPCPV
jgi:hypothetical protein